MRPHRGIDQHVITGNLQHLVQITIYRRRLPISCNATRMRDNNIRLFNRKYGIKYTRTYSGYESISRV